VSEPSPLLDREGIEEAFRRLGDRLAKRGVVADIYVFGGAAMALAYDSRRATRDVDVLFRPHGIVLEEAQAVAAELGLPNWRLNEQASSYAAPSGHPSASRVFDHPGLRVFAASPEHLLAMKALAARSAVTSPPQTQCWPMSQCRSANTKQSPWTRQPVKIAIAGAASWRAGRIHADREPLVRVKAAISTPGIPDHRGPQNMVDRCATAE